jgi:DNA-binding transcriptional LysR family regulator
MLLTYQDGLPDWWTRCEVVAQLEPYVLLPALHPLAEQESVSLADLAQEPLILHDTTPSGQAVMALYEERQLTPRVAYRSPSYEMVLSMVGNGLGYTLLGTRPASPITLDGRLTVARPLQDECPTSKVVLVTDTSRDISDDAREVYDYIAEALSIPQ